MGSRLVLTGTGGPPPDPQRAGPSQAVEVDGRPYLVDVGDRATTRLQEAGVALEAVETALVTHLHSDHTLGYGQLLLGGWALGRQRLAVRGPQGTAHLHDTLVNDLYQRDIAYRIGVGRSGAGLTDADVADVGPGLVLHDDRVRVTAVEVVHDVTTLAYRFDTAHGSVVISGDTAVSPQLVELAAGCDVLVHDASIAPNTRFGPDASARALAMWEQLKKVHASPGQAGEVAQRAGAATLVLTHLVPGTDVDAAGEEAQQPFAGRVIVGHDLLEVGV